MKQQNDDSIILQDLVFYGYHGVMPEENKVGCRFSLNVTCGLDLSKAANSDELDDTISYELLFNSVRDAFAEKQFKLLEALAPDVCHLSTNQMDKNQSFQTGSSNSCCHRTIRGKTISRAR